MGKFDERNLDRKVWCVDLDGTLTNGEHFWETEPTPKWDQIKSVQQLYTAGNVIVVHTARMWEHAQETVAWLIKFGVPFHGIRMDKGGADHYLDDKNVLCKDLSAQWVSDSDNFVERLR